jgi:phage/plasmid-like protein (TIGR03299 family)
LGIFSDGYLGHQYEEWLLKTVASILDADLGIGSAGLLRNRAQAWVSVEVPDNIVTPEGVEFRPNLVAATSFDGSLATTYGRCVTNVVCDNTLAAGLGERGQRIKLRHTKNSGLRIAEAREALAIIHTVSEDFAAEVAELCAWEVSKREFDAHLDAMIPVPAEEGRSRTIAENKRERIVSLYEHDDRVAPWAGTAFGVLQAHNTYRHHYATVRGASQVQRNHANKVEGATAVADLECLSVLAKVTGHEFVNAAGSGVN